MAWSDLANTIGKLVGLHRCTLYIILLPRRIQLLWKCFIYDFSTSL